MTIWDYEDEYYEYLENGEARCKGIRRALDKALESQDIDNALKLYHEFIIENNLFYDAYEALIIFPEYLALFEKYPKYQEDNRGDLMWSYKMIIGSIADFYQIPMKQILDIYRQYDLLCKRFNYNQRSYYRHMWGLMYWHGLDSFPGVENIADCHRKMMKCPIDHLSEIPAGECDDLVKYILFVEKDIEKAYKKAEPILSGKLSCPQVPLFTYINFAIYYFREGNLESTKIFLEKAWRIMNRNYGSSSANTFDKGFCIIMYAYIDVKKAVQIFRRQFLLCGSNSCGIDNFYLFLGGYHTFKQLEIAGEEKVGFTLPSDEKSIYKVSELKQYFYDKTKQVADRFDERNGNSHFNDLLNKEYLLKNHEE